MTPKIFTGTSGWNYSHWAGVFYPSDRPKSKWLEFYTKNFSTVEVNATFYRLPKEKTFEGWRDHTPGEFLWSVKASRYITHIKRLNDVREPLDRFFNAVEPLKEKLGPVLFQLPPSLSFDAKIFAHFCRQLKPDHLYTVEVRHPSWIDDDAFRIMRDHNIALCISDTAGRYPYYEAVTADFIYIRLHGSERLYESLYSEAELQAWAEKLKNWKKDTFIYFDNDFNGNAPKNARRLKEILSPR
jgi:uncharacterized protein YecE (DUF72 family)